MAGGLAIGIGFVYTYFFGFLIGIAAGIAAFIVVGLLFAVSRIRTRSTAMKVLFVSGLIIALLFLTYVFGIYGGIAYIILMLVLYYLRRNKRRSESSDPPFP